MSFVMPESAANSLQKSLGMVESQSCGPLGVLEDALESIWYETVCVSFGTSSTRPMSTIVLDTHIDSTHAHMNRY